MDNPFLKRATEFLRDEDAFLAIVTPEPVSYFLKAPGQSGQLYDRLVVLRGTPGSGKTTLARLFEYPTLSALLQHRDAKGFRPLYMAMRSCGAFSDDAPAVVGCRLPLETDYRDFWEFPYPEELRLGLTTALIQARAVLAWLRNLSATGIRPDQVEVVPRPESEAATQAIGGIRGVDVLEKARAVELSLYKVVAALVAPDVSQLDSVVTEAYRPFDVIDRLRVTTGSDDDRQVLELIPLVILDDAHALHPLQFRRLQHWMVRRELRVARWILSRLDVLSPGEVLASVTVERDGSVDLPGLTASRDTTEISLQSTLVDRTDQRSAFRKMARDMANRYLHQMSLFGSRNLVTLEDLLDSEPKSLPASKLKQLRAYVDAAQNRLLIPQVRRDLLFETVDKYRPRSGELAEDLRLSMLDVFMHRYVKRTPQMSLFDEESGPEPTRPLIADATVVDAARIHLLHQFDRPYFYGMDNLCDASSENAEQFLRLAAILVESSVAQIVRGKSPTLDAAMQHRLLRNEAGKILDAWDFPHCQAVRQLVRTIACRCLNTSLEPNAPLGAGANAYGVDQEEVDQIPDRNEELARVLQFAIAYNAVTIVPHYMCKGREWCLIELGGLVILHHGLTLKRGGFLEGTVGELSRMAQEIDR